MLTSDWVIKFLFRFTVPNGVECCILDYRTGCGEFTEFISGSSRPSNFFIGWRAVFLLDLSGKFTNLVAHLVLEFSILESSFLLNRFRN